jgi:hypothetical protein
MPPGILPRFKSLMHVSQTRAVDSRTENEKLFLENRPADFDFDSMIPLTGFRPRVGVFKSDADHSLVSAEKFGTESGAVVCAMLAGANNVAANMAMIKANR